MGKRGPKKKEGPRYPCGKLKPVRFNDALVPTLAQRSREHLEKLAGDPRLGSAIGRLFLGHRISALEYSAGIKFAEVYARASFYGCTLKRAPKSPAWEMGLKACGQVGTEVSDSADETLNNPTLYEMRALAAKEALRAVFDVIPELQIYILERLCLDDEPLTAHEFAIARTLLQKLISHFGTEAAPKKEKRTKTQPKNTAKVVKIRPDMVPLYERDYFISILQRVQPVLTRDEASVEWSNFCALRDRELYRNSRENRIGAL